MLHLTHCESLQGMMNIYSLQIQHPEATAVQASGRPMNEVNQFIGQKTHQYMNSLLLCCMEVLECLAHFLCCLHFGRTWL